MRACPDDLQLGWTILKRTCPADEQLGGHDLGVDQCARGARVFARCCQEYDVGWRQADVACLETLRRGGKCFGVLKALFRFERVGGVWGGYPGGGDVGGVWGGYPGG